MIINVNAGRGQTIKQSLIEPLRSKTKYEVAYEFLANEIARGAIKPGDKLPNEDALSRMLGVSRVTIRQALSRLEDKKVIKRKPGSGTFVTKNFEINNKTSAPNHNTISKNIAVLVPRLDLPDWANAVNGLFEAAHSNSLELLIANTEDDPARYSILIERQINNNPFGVVIGFYGCKPPINLETISLLKKSNLPIVTLFGTIPYGDWPCVISNGEQHAYLAAKHLCDIGRKKIAFITTNRSIALNLTEMHGNLCGFIHALSESGVTYYPELKFVIENWRYDRAIEDRDVQLSCDIENWLLMHKNIDAICCTTDHIAARVLHILEKNGVKIPDDIAVTGIGGTLRKYHNLPPDALTTVDMCINDIGNEVCKLIVAMREGETFGDITIAVPGKLLVGRSTINCFTTS